MLKLFTEPEYKSTMTEKMLDVTQTAEPVIDIWPTVEKLVKAEIVHNYTFKNHLVEVVYRNQNSTFEHVLLPTPDKNKFVVIIIDLLNTEIAGYFPLNLDSEYSLN